MAVRGGQEGGRAGRRGGKWRGGGLIGPSKHESLRESDHHDKMAHHWITQSKQDYFFQANG